MNLKGKRVLLTGASGGIGAAMAKQLAEAGASLLLTGRREEQLQKVLTTLPGNTHSLLVADLSRTEGIDRVVEAGKNLSIDVLINNAGISDFRLLEDTAEQDVSRMLATNVETPIQLCRALLPVLRDKPVAAIVNVGSVLGAIGYPGYSLYCSTKFALRGFTEALRRELAETSVHVHLLSPRATDTDINSQAVSDLNRELGSGVDSPALVARELMGMLQSKCGGHRVIGWPEKLFARINGAFPGIVDGALKKQLPVIHKYAALNKIS